MMRSVARNATARVAVGFGAVAASRAPVQMSTRIARVQMQMLALTRVQSRLFCSSCISLATAAPQSAEDATSWSPLPEGFTTDTFNAQDYLLPDALQVLTQRNGCATDARVHFDESEHAYYFDGQRMLNSVTQVVERYGAPFDAVAAIHTMKRGKLWPRPEYQGRDGRPWADEDIQRFWEGTGECARHRGTYMHYLVERHCNGLATRADTPEMQQYLSFYAEIMQGNNSSGGAKMNIEPWRTEWRVCAPELQLAGSVDFVGRLADGTYAIVDWKRSQKIADAASGKPKGFRPRPMLAPLAHLADDAVHKYYLQLNLYRRLLQMHYDLPVSRMLLAGFSPDQLGYAALEVPLMEAEVDAVLEEQAQLVAATAAAASRAGAE